MNDELQDARRAFISWMTQLDADAAGHALAVFKNKLELCAFHNCFDDAHIHYKHRKYCLHHYKQISGEAN
jgi:hypothetical protein